MGPTISMNYGESLMDMTIEDVQVLMFRADHGAFNNCMGFGPPIESDNRDLEQIIDTMRAYQRWGDLAKPGPVRAAFGLSTDDYVEFILTDLSALLKQQAE